MQVDVETLLTYALATMGAATAIVAALNAAIVPLRDWAKCTTNTTDDKALEKVSNVLDIASQVLLVIGRVIAPLAARNPKKVFPPAPQVAK